MADGVTFEFVYKDGSGGSSAPASAGGGQSRPAGGASRSMGYAEGTQPAGSAYAAATSAAGGGPARSTATDTDRLVRTLAAMPFFGSAISLLADMAGHLRMILGVVAAGSRAAAAAGAASGGARVVSSSVAGAAGSAAGRAALPGPASSSTALSVGIARPVAGGAIAGLGGAGGVGGAAAGGAIVGLSATGIGLAVAAGLAVNMMVMRAVTRQFEKVIDTVRQFDRELLAAAQRLSPYNADLAGANARAQMSQVLGDIRQAQQLGPQLSRYQDARTQQERAEQRLSTMVEDLKLRYMAPLAEVGANIESAAANIAEFLLPFLKTALPDPAMVQVLFKAALSLFPGAEAAFRALVKEKDIIPQIGDPILDAIFFGGGFQGFNQPGPIQARPLMGHMNEAGVAPFKPLNINGGDLGGVR